MDPPPLAGEEPSPPPATSARPQILEIRLFYVRVSPCAPDAIPPHLTLSHKPSAALEINSANIPSSVLCSLSLRRNRVDRDAAEVTYVSTESVRLSAAVDLQISDDLGNLIVSGSLDRAAEAASPVGPVQHQAPSAADKDPKTGWTMDCSIAPAISYSAFVQPKLGILAPSFEVYVAGCSAGSPLILTQTIHHTPPRKSARIGNVDAVPEDNHAEGSHRRNAPPSASTTMAHKEKGKGKGKGKSSGGFLSRPKDSLRALKESMFRRATDEVPSASSSETTTPRLDGDATPSGSRGQSSGASAPQINLGDEDDGREDTSGSSDDPAPIQENQHVYLDSRGQVKIDTIAAKTITATFYQRGDPNGVTWSAVGPEYVNFYWWDFQKNNKWDKSIPDEKVYPAFCKRAGGLYRRFAYNQRTGRVKKKATPLVLTAWEEKAKFQQVSEQKKANRRRKKTENPALPTWTGGSVPFLETLTRMRTKSQGQDVSISDVHKYTKTKRHDGETWVSPEEQRIATEFGVFRDEAVSRNMGYTDEEMYEYVGGHNSKYRVSGVGDYERDMRPLKSSSSQSSYSQTSRRMSTSQDSEVAMLREQNRQMMEEMQAMKTTQASILEQLRRLHGGFPPPPRGPDDDGMGGG